MTPSINVQKIYKLKKQTIKPRTELHATPSSTHAIPQASRSQHKHAPEQHTRVGEQHTHKATTTAVETDMLTKINMITNCYAQELFKPSQHGTGTWNQRRVLHAFSCNPVSLPYFSHIFHNSAWNGMEPEC